MSDRFKLFVFLGFTLIHFNGFGQSGFMDYFDDGNISSSPIWIGETSKFIVNSNNQLQLNSDPPSSPAYIVTQSSILDSTTWEFYVKMDFAPSNANYAEVYLLADSSDFNRDIKGYFLRIGGISGSADDVSLYRSDSSQSPVEIIDGTDSIAGSGPVELKIKVFRSKKGLWSLFVDQDLNGNYLLEGTSVVDTTYLNANYFGVRCVFSSTRKDKFFFDDFNVFNSPFQDTVPPIINSFSIIDNNSIELQFSEGVDSVTANTTSNYFVNQSIGFADTITYNYGDSSRIKLDFINLFTNGVNYEFIAKDVEDLAGNKLLSDTLRFFYFKSEIAIFEDVLINEFYPDPSSSNGLPDAEFVELYNRSSKLFNLKDWKLSDANSTVTLDSFLLAPNKFVILCRLDQLSQFQAYGDVLGVSGFPSLNNSGDEIVIQDFSNKKIAELKYDTDWYKDPSKSGGGWSIELINPDSKCEGTINYTASNFVSGGTPGSINSVYDTLPDSSNFRISQFNIVSDTSLLLEFNKPIDSSTINASSILITNGINITAKRFDFNKPYELILDLDQALDSGVLYQLRVFLLKDCFGITVQSDLIEIVIPAIANYRDIVINEFLSDFSPSVGLPEAEFVELFNASDKIIDLDGWVLSDGSTFSTINSSTILLAGEYIILCHSSNQNAFDNYGRTYGLSSFPSLNNTSDEIKLRSSNSKLIDIVRYTVSWHQNSEKASGGFSLEQINPFLKCSGAYNFNSSLSKIGGSPGSQNSIYDGTKDTDPPIFERIAVFSKDSILLTFNEGIDSLSVQNATFLFSNGSSILFTEFNFPEYNELTATISPSLDSGDVIQLTIDGLDDCSFNEMEETSLSFALAEREERNDIAINEVLFNPRTGGFDFVELYNRSSKILDLKEWQISNEDTTLLKTITVSPYLVYPGQYVGLTENIENIKKEYANTVEKNFIEVDDLPSFNDDQGTVYLFNENERIVDLFSYDEKMHFELLVDEEGVSLERIDPDRESEDITNFISAAETDGFATPGIQNSQYFVSSKFDGEVNIEPETISPNNDGYQDILNINYSFGKTSYVVNIAIYNSKGSLVKNLVNNVTIGSKGVFTWDGLNDDNNKASIGVYIVYFEVFDLEGDKELFKLPFVVASQLD